MQVQATTRPYEMEKALVDRVFFFDKDEPKESSTNWTSVIQVDLPFILLQNGSIYSLRGKELVKVYETRIKSERAVEIAVIHERALVYRKADGTIISQNVVIKLPSFAGKPIRLHSGYAHMFIQTEDGVYFHGDNSYKQSGIPQLSSSNVQKVQALDNLRHSYTLHTGGWHAFAITMEPKGNLYGWGYNYKSRLGISESQSYVDTPTKSSRFFDTRVVNAHCGRWQSSIITESGEVFLLGSHWNNHGTIDLNVSSAVDSPVVRVCMHPVSFSSYFMTRLGQSSHGLLSVAPKITGAGINYVMVSADDLMLGYQLREKISLGEKIVKVTKFYDVDILQ